MLEQVRRKLSIHTLNRVIQYKENKSNREITIGPEKKETTIYFPGDISEIKQLETKSALLVAASNVVFYLTVTVNEAMEIQLSCPSHIDVRAPFITSVDTQRVKIPLIGSEKNKNSKEDK